MVLNSSHLHNTSKMAFKKYHMLILHKNCSYLERKQKELHLLLKSDPNLIWKSFEESINNLGLSFIHMITLSHLIKDKVS